MTSNKLRYDSLLGGSEVLPTHLPTYRYASSCVEEIKELLSEIRHPTHGSKLAFQKLPKHMRRRAMSHHPKRLPRKYHAIHRAQMAKSGKPHQAKRPSRKYRRKPSNLLREYIRRQRKHTWLETHIWHAKRFHMVTRWGYRLPYASCDKMYRACYRATADHCLLQDISFYACLQFEGTLTEISTGFAKVSSSRCGLSVAARTYVSGRREGSLELFRVNQYPEEALGKVMFMWKPLTENDEVDGKRLLWVWVHPSGYQAILEEFIKVFELTSMKSIKVPLEEEAMSEEKSYDGVQEEFQEQLQKEADGDGDAKMTTVLKKRKRSCGNAPKSMPKKQLRRLQFMTRTFGFERIKRYTNAANTLHLSDLKDTMNRFRLTGPLAHSVLAHAFKVAHPADRSATQTSPPHWFHAQLAQQQSFLDHHQTQSDFWQDCANLNTPAVLMSNIIVALNIEDPRLNRPQKRTKAVPQCNLSFPQLQKWLIDPPATLAHSSCLWQAGVRDNICAQMLSTHAYCENRAKHSLVPGDPCIFETEMQPVPVLLVQRPGSQQPSYKRLGYGCGWDVIAPAGYGMPIWMALIMWGAKPGGLREFGSIARELGTDEFLPDTVGGQQHFGERYLELHSKYFRLPPNKRCNYSKFSIVSPFRAPLKDLVRDWMPTAITETTTIATTTANPTDSLPSSPSSPSSGNFFVLRDRALLEQLYHCIAHKNSDFPSVLSPKCLVQLQFLMKSRGNPGDFALVCLPTRKDYKRNLKRIYRGNHEPVYTEPLKADPNEKKRKLLRTEHKKLLKRLRRKRLREKYKLQETSTVKVHIRPSGTAHLVAAQFKRMSELWLPDLQANKLHSVRQQCTRQVFGYLTNCNFSFVEARVCAVGYVTLEGLRQLLNLCRTAHLKQPMCLVRGTDSRHYRFASFKINLQI